MAKYTTEVRSICEVNAGLIEQAGYSDIEDILTESAPKIFDFSFPIFDEDYRLPLERKILKHYYTREISEETVGLWKLRLNAKMNEIMPYYNQLYESELLEFNPLYDTDLTTTHTRDIDGENTGDTDSVSTSNYNGTGTSDSWNKFSATPQGGIDGLADDKYLTQATHNTGTSTEEGSRNGTQNTDYKGTSKTLEEYAEHIVGKRGSTSYSKMLQEFRETFLNIDMMIIDDLKDLFFNLW